MDVTGRCVKQEVIAIVEKDGKFWTGTNHCFNPQEECPRKDMKTGEGYELCKSICDQSYHAEVNACINAGKENTKGATLYLLGHSYCCEPCKEYMKEMGIKKVIIVKGD